MLEVMREQGMNRKKDKHNNTSFNEFTSLHKEEIPHDCTGSFH